VQAVSIAVDEQDFTKSPFTATTDHMVQQLAQLQRPTVAAHHQLQSWVTDVGLPVGTAALWITGNTVGAGCLVMPELASGPGLAAVTGMFVTAWLLNLFSGLVIAQVAIAQHETKLVNNSESDMEVVASSSFKDFAAANLGSRTAANAVSGISLFVNACVLAFDLSRAGSVGAALSGLPEATISIAWAAGVAISLTTLSTDDTGKGLSLSLLCSACVAALFASFGALLLPGLAAVPDAAAVFAAPGTSPDCWTCAAHTFPVILMSMVYQNIVPVVVKLVHYDRTKAVAALTLGSAIPLAMYTSWCYACLGGGIDTDILMTGPSGINGLLMTVFSLATLAGSSLCSSMSLTEELNTFFVGNNKEETTTTATTDSSSYLDETTLLLEAPQLQQEASTAATGFQVPAAALASVSVPLVAALVLGGEGGLTGALSVAGSFGSPVLYGVIPALMAWRQRQDQPLRQTQQTQYLVPSATLPLLAVLSTGFVGQEMVSRMGELVAFVS
jgi:tyrosine-specific transport protein